MSPAHSSRVNALVLQTYMPRHLIALLISLYAISFAFGAMAAIRWPSIVMVSGLMLENDPLSQATAIDWRQLGIAYGAPYFLAALCLYASALSLSKRRHGAVSWYFMGVISGFPCVFLVDFESGWWRNPSAGEGAVAGAALASILLGIAVWSLRKRPALKKQAQPAEAQPVIDITWVDADIW